MSLFNTKELEKFPVLPGVYLMKDRDQRVIYVGKAKNLKARVKQYFSKSPDERPMIPHLVAQIASIDTIVVNSEKEALLVENTLIKKHKPRYNAFLKDDKSYFSLELNTAHQWPMLRVVRYKSHNLSKGILFGPYTYAHAARETLEILRRLFPLRQCSDQELLRRTRPCILHELKRCIAPCVGKCTKEQYDDSVDHLIRFLQGQDLHLLKKLNEEMEKAVENLEFEKADALLKTIKHIEHTLERQKVDKAGFEDTDVIGIARDIDHVVVTQLFYREGKLIGSNDHLFSYNAQDDDTLLGSFLLQTYGDQEMLPKKILLPNKVESEETLALLITPKLLVPEKGEKKKLVEMAIKNAEAKLKRSSEAKDLKEKVLIALEEECHLTNYPDKIECFDNSHLSGQEPVSALVVFERGEKKRALYRTYKIKEASFSDDYGALKEVLKRRFSKAKDEDNLPDLLLIDGGRGHLNVALEILSSLDISTVDVIAITKEESKHSKGILQEKIHISTSKEPLFLKATSPLLLFLQEVRDEAHRFVLTFQKKRRSKRSLSSEFETLPGIGPIKRLRLLRTFGSLKNLLEHSEEEWKKVPGINKKDIETLLALKAKNQAGK